MRLNGQQMGKKTKPISKMFKYIGLRIYVETNLKEADFLDIKSNR